MGPTRRETTATKLERRQSQQTSELCVESTVTTVTPLCRKEKAGLIKAKSAR